MPQDVRLTIREVGESIHRQYGGPLVPDWKLRRVVDGLESSGDLDVPRVGMYRTVSANDVCKIAVALQRLGWVTSTATLKTEATHDE